MSVILEREFATAEDTAAALGVSKARLKRLLRIAGPESRTNGAGYKASRNMKAAVSLGRSSPRRKQTRGKAKKTSH
jgi:hypothetical protein